MKTFKQTKSSIKLDRRIVMKKLNAVVALTTTLMGATLLLQTTLKVAAAPPPTGIKNVVLVHGAFADGSGWEAVAKILEKDGYTVSVVQHPETSFAEDVKFTKAEIDRQPGPVVLVGHSYGGAVITEAGNDPNVAPSPLKTERRSIIRIGAQDSRLFSVTAGLYALMPLRIKCSFWLRTVIAVSPMTAAAMGAPASPGKAMTWTPRTNSPPAKS
jgi:pimeloyl-ACP methyl ester carboxylesterase